MLTNCFTYKVPLGIYLKGEQKYEEMIEVLSHLHQYIPTVTTEDEVTVQVDEEPMKVKTVMDTFFSIPIGNYMHDS